MGVCCGSLIVLWYDNCLRPVDASSTAWRGLRRIALIFSLQLIWKFRYLKFKIKLFFLSLYATGMFLDIDRIKQVWVCNILSLLNSPLSFSVTFHSLQIITLQTKAFLRHFSPLFSVITFVYSRLSTNIMQNSSNHVSKFILSKSDSTLQFR